MITAGVDIGSLSADVVILEDDRIRSYSVIPTGADSAETAERAMALALERAEMSLSDVQYVVGTGYGRFVIPFADRNITEISCHARGAVWLFPTARTLLDMGGQDCKAIRCNGEGRVTNFIMNDKCAAGTGRFFEIMSKVMKLRLQDLGGLSLQADGQDVSVSSACAVFAKSDMIALMRRGVAKTEILAALHDAISRRAYGLLERVGVEQDLVMTGGIAKNVGIVTRVGTRAGAPVRVSEEPQIVGALGAALFAQDKLRGGAQGLVRDAKQLKSDLRAKVTQG